MENLDDILHIKGNNVKPAPGKILISEPFLYDHYFKRSVVLLADHNKEGSFGVIINKPMAVDFNEVVKDFPGFVDDLYLGGPVSTNNLFYVHTLGDQITAARQAQQAQHPLFCGLRRMDAPPARHGTKARFVARGRYYNPPNDAR
jgi:putative AlgH/UPF0301 family transcriptional regulator